ncbi:MAG: DPP IV N-terminal domain-containing protein, partial [Ginsengibacter sp.]
MMYFVKSLILFIVTIGISLNSFSQFTPKEVNWTADGNGITTFKDGNIVKTDLTPFAETILVKKEQLIPTGNTKPLEFNIYNFSTDYTKLLIYTNTAKVWRYNTRGDYWVLDIPSNKLIQLGKGRPSQSLMFAKLSPDNKKAAYVSGHNIYVEDLSTHQITQLTKDGTRKLINGTFDWAYEEEFFCRDGFRWSPDSRQIAYWQIDARNVKDYLMIDNTDSIYPFVKPVEYPIAGEAPSPFKIGVVNITNAQTKWMNISTDPVLQSYVPRMEWAANSSELIIQHLNRKQNKSDIELCNVTNGTTKTIYTERDSAWIDILSLWDQDYSNGGWDWLDNGKEFLWASEKDGWRHLYRISMDGKKETLITNGNFDVMDISAINESTGYIYFFASPENATQKYLYRTKLDGKGQPERVSPNNQQGTHDYNVSPSGSFALHTFSNYYTPT